MIAFLIIYIVGFVLLFALSTFIVVMFLKIQKEHLIEMREKDKKIEYYKKELIKRSGANEHEFYEN